MSSSIDSQPSRQEFWEEHIHAWQLSGLSKARYCREHELSYHQFIYWVPKVRPNTKPDVCARQLPRLVPVALQQQAANSALQIKLPNGAIISGISADNIGLVCALMAQP